MQTNTTSPPDRHIPLLSGSKPAPSGEVEISGRRYVTADRLAATLGVTVRTLHRWDAARIGAPKTKIGKTVLYRLEGVAAWLASREAEPIRASGRRR